MHIAMTKKTLFAAALAMASTVSAHMVMYEPVPFGPGTPNNSPLDKLGSNFPCKIGPGGSYVVETMNEWTVGSEVILKINPNDTATHGGGSCQVSVTKDKEPTPQSIWKVIHSIEGGCPTSDPANDGKVHNFPFTVPSELPEGQLTMAWTWFNRIGDREMYMNCAPIKVSGGSGDGFDSLPDMAVANIAGQGTCKTEENFDYAFANPGKYVTKMHPGNPVQGLCGGAPSEGSSTGGGAAPSQGSNTGGYGSNGGSGSPGGVNSGNSGAAVPPATPIETPKQPNATTPKEPEATTPKEPESSAPKPPSTGNSSSGNSSSGGSSSGGASDGVASSGGSSCSEEGAITCKDQDHFGICSNGSLVWQSVAAGTACNNGVIARRGYVHRHQRHSI
jgi:hypothetical protein